MAQLRRWFGRLTTGVGVVGIMLSVIGVVVVWRAAITLSAQVVQIANVVVDAEEIADRHVGQAEKVVADLEERVISLKQACDEVSGDSAENREFIPLLQELDGEIVRALGRSRSLMESMQSGTVAFRQAISLFNSLSSPMRMLGSSAAPRENSDLDELSSSLTESSERIQQVIDLVAKMEKRGITESEARELKFAVARLAEELARSRARLRALQEFLESARKSIVAKRDRTPMWTRFVATYLTVLLVCFGFTQIQLIAFGRSIVAGMTSRRVI